MNILCKKPANLVNIDSLRCGEAFMTKRKSHADEIGLYMVVDLSLIHISEPTRQF